MSDINEAKWYVVHTYSGYENKVASDLALLVENRKMQDLILDIKIPTETVTEVKEDKVKEYERKIFPGYVLVKMGVFYDTKSGEMKMTDEAWYVVRNTRGVTGFVGPGSKPVPLSEEEMRSLGFKTTGVIVDFAVGEAIVVISGAWKDTIGVIKSVNESKQTITINVEMFGRETPVELSFSEVKKM